MLDKLKFLSFASLLFAFCLASCAKSKVPANNSNIKEEIINPMANLDTATFGAGCFWCVEAIFQDMKGVQKVVSGYTGGQVDNPTYKEVCTGNTGHAEVIQIYYDPAVVSFKDLLEVFWQTHDPTTLNRQGNDEGTQYRSAVFYHNAEQKELSEKYKKELDQSGAFSSPIVTEIVPISKFFAAEDYHQNYFNLNKGQPYCTYVIKPKVEKFKKVFGDKVKK
ncbi:peptide-methionine (S)-S-oxide reductase MsrA [Sporocytophaga myxococcoides]|uniref:peptide-methionine (S)-S-oxide reductase MsrA n=1 Tax=Sporocytophaga myxococcoides TaxID=153721 RepID=UPI00041BC272